MTAPAKSGAFSRNKGKRGELAVVAMLRDNLGLECNRNYKQPAQSQEGDIEQLVGGHLLEVKNHATLNLKAWWKQAVTAADKRGAIPCLVYKQARGQWRFVVPIPAAWATGHQWARDYQYTMTLEPDGFYFLIREQG